MEFQDSGMVILGERRPPAMWQILCLLLWRTNVPESSSSGLMSVQFAFPRLDALDVYVSLCPLDDPIDTAMF